MNYAELVASVDRVRFRTACATLLDEGLSTHLCEQVLACRLPAQGRLELLLRLFHELPLYSVLASTKPLLAELSPAGRDLLWHELASAAARERSAAADAAETALFADFFADSQCVDEAWNVLISPGHPEGCLRCALRVSSPVPWRLKRLVFARLLADPNGPKWHPLLFQALRGARHAFFGATVDREEGLLVLDRLTLPGREGELIALQKSLGELP